MFILQYLKSSQLNVVLSLSLSLSLCRPSFISSGPSRSLPHTSSAPPPESMQEQTEQLQNAFMLYLNNNLVRYIITKNKLDFSDDQFSSQFTAIGIYILFNSVSGIPTIIIIIIIIIIITIIMYHSLD